MSGPRVLGVVSDLRDAGVRAWVDGGWGVDALLEEQTRDHDDLDLVVPVISLGTCRAVLEGSGFVLERDWLPTALALRASDGRAVDLHPVEPTADGGGDQIQRDGVTRWHYPAPVLGRIEGVQVRCCSLDCQVRAHLGYDPRPSDRADMEALAHRFGIVLPAPYGGT